MLKKRWVPLAAGLSIVGMLSGCGSLEENSVAAKAQSSTAWESRIGQPNASSEMEEEILSSEISGVESAEESPVVRPPFCAGFDMDKFQNGSADLTPAIGEYLTIDEEGEIQEDPNGVLYGYYDDITYGCSVWCAIGEYIQGVSATSHLEPQGKQSYEPSNLCARNRSFAWVEGAEGYGVHESVELTYQYSTGDGEDICFYDLCIVNGLARTEKSWKANSRVKKLRMYYNGEIQGDLELLDTDKPQYISLYGLGLKTADCEEAVFRFEILDVYPGEEYEDTAITGIEVGIWRPNH